MYANGTKTTAGVINVAFSVKVDSSGFRAAGILDEGKNIGSVAYEGSDCAGSGCTTLNNSASSDTASASNTSYFSRAAQGRDWLYTNTSDNGLGRPTYSSKSINTVGDYTAATIADINGQQWNGMSANPSTIN